MIYPLFLYCKSHTPFNLIVSEKIFIIKTVKNYPFINEYFIFVVDMIKRKIMKKYLLLLLFLLTGISNQFCSAQVSKQKHSFEGYKVTDKGAWCWFADDSLHLSTNVLGNSDAWKQYQRTTNGKWLEPMIPNQFILCITYTNKKLLTYINGLLDQSIDIDNLQVNEPKYNLSKDISTQYKLYNRALGQDEIKQLVQKIKIP